MLGVDLVPSRGCSPSEGVLTGDWSGFPWSPTCVVTLKAQDELFLCFAILSRPALPSVCHVMVPLGLAHPSGCYPDSSVALIPFLCLGLDYFMPIGAEGSGGSCWRLRAKSQALLFSFSRLITRPHHPPSPFEKG
jgi:hypothetical protein